MGLPALLEGAQCVGFSPLVGLTYYPYTLGRRLLTRQRQLRDRRRNWAIILDHAVHLRAREDAADDLQLLHVGKIPIVTLAATNPVVVAALHLAQVAHPLGPQPIHRQGHDEELGPARADRREAAAAIPL